MKLEEMVVVITGATGDTAQELINIISGKVKHVISTVRSTNNQLSFKHTVHLKKGDLTRKRDVKKIHQSIINEYGTIHAWVNVVGGFTMGNVVENSRGKWKQMIDVNFFTTMNCCEVILPTFKKNKFGRLINFGSQVGKTGMPFAGPYCVSKAMVHMLTKVISQELSDNVTCNAIVPGVIDTPRARKSMPNADFSTWNTPADLTKAVMQLMESSKNGALIEI